MRALLTVTAAFLAGMVCAMLMPVEGPDDELATRVFTADEHAPRLLADAVPKARPLPAAEPAESLAAAAPDRAVTLASAEQPVAADWPQWGGTPSRNNAPRDCRVPIEWDLGKIDRRTGSWDLKSARNIKWVARLGSQSYGNPVVAGGRVFVGTNNAAGYVPRYPKNVDLGCLLAFAQRDGRFLWQYSSEKLPSGRVHDWPMQGICCSPLVEADRLWLVTNRGEVVCLDPHGFYDDENDGPYREEPAEDPIEADVVWKFDMMGRLGVRQHNMASCSVTAWRDLLFVATSNGVDESEEKVAAPEAPSFLALEKSTGHVVWQDNSPGTNILHGQWSSPAAGVLGGVPQVVFAGGDGWLYAFQADRGREGRPTPLWKFDCNPKDSQWIAGGRGTRNNLIATPVIYDGRVYVAVGQDPENGEGAGHLWCVDPTRRGDVSPELVVIKSDPTQIVPPRRVRAADPERGEQVIPNPNSAAVWHYHQHDADGDGRFDFEETMHRTLGTVAIANDLLFVADYGGLFHCVGAKTGRPHWTHDMLACAWGSPLIAGEYVYIGDEDGDLTVFRLQAAPHEPLAEVNLLNSIYSTPVAADNVLYITNRTHLFAIAKASP